jgi:predicted AAA+ superfamily ATPase
MKNIILISGQQGSGKSSLARAIVVHINENRGDLLAIHLKFATPLYEMQEALREVAQKYSIPFEKKRRSLTSASRH